METIPSSGLPEDNLPSMDTIGEEPDVMLRDTVAEFVEQDNPSENTEESNSGLHVLEEEKSKGKEKLDTQKTIDSESGGCNQSLPVTVEDNVNVEQGVVEQNHVNIRKDQEETIDNEDLGIVDEDKEIAEQLMSAPIDALELSHKLSEHEDQTLEGSFRVEEAGAIPFELHPTFNENTASNDDIDLAMPDEIMKEKMNDASEVTIYHYDGSYNSEKVIIYLRERNIQFTSVYVDLQENAHLSRWYLHINPRGEVPAMSLHVSKGEDNVESKVTPPSSAKKTIVCDSTKIIHTLESKYSLEAGYFPSLVPDSSDASGYQEYIYYTALLDQVSSCNLFIIHISRFLSL